MQNQSQISKSRWNILKLLKWTTSYFKSHNIDKPRTDAEILLSYALKLRRIDLYLRYDQPLSDEELSLFKSYIKRRIHREPVAYIVGTKGFWTLDFKVKNDVLIPRPETECLVEAALLLLPEDSNPIPKYILDLGTGSGAITLSLASQRPKNIFFASDRSIRAISIAHRNAKDYDLDGIINFFVGDWFNPIKADIHPFDMIISNPPYIPSGMIGRLQPEIYLYEPIEALDGGEDGLYHVRQIIQWAHAYLNKNGFLLLEIGHDQRDDVLEIINNCNKYDNIVFENDLSGFQRVVQMRKK
ncbi:MAG: peptide chain release factor N(5)-glutamine methyltransferase [Desulfobacterales bacterium]|nr:peptide chain release factor N(5)-glutamine methyltransferase [Desulfobacterales bacterium]